MRTRSMLIAVFMLWIPCVVFFGQEDIVKAVRVKPLYSIDPTSLIHRDGTISKVRITFQNTDVTRIKILTFDLKIWQKDSLILYSARHTIKVDIRPEETQSFDLPLLEKMSPPDGEKDFENASSWGWKIDIVSVNH